MARFWLSFFIFTQYFQVEILFTSEKTRLEIHPKIVQIAKHAKWLKTDLGDLIRIKGLNLGTHPPTP